MTNQFSVDGGHINDVVARLETIAGKLEHTVTAHRSALTVKPAGADEVSVTAARSFDATAEAFDHQVGKGIAAIREVADALRQQTAAVDAHDQSIAGDMFVV